jgi:hypothetical protein
MRRQLVEAGVHAFRVGDGELLVRERREADGKRGSVHGTTLLPLVSVAC